MLSSVKKKKKKTITEYNSGKKTLINPSVCGLKPNQDFILCSSLGFSTEGGRVGVVRVKNGLGTGAEYTRNSSQPSV